MRSRPTICPRERVQTLVITPCCQHNALLLCLAVYRGAAEGEVEGAPERRTAVDAGDEMSASSPAEMTQLFELAVGDYLSVPLWRKYLE
jgi:hypothetical protein